MEHICIHASIFCFLSTNEFPNEQFPIMAFHHLQGISIHQLYMCTMSLWSCIISLQNSGIPSVVLQRHNMPHIQRVTWGLLLHSFVATHVWLGLLRTLPVASLN